MLDSYSFWRSFGLLGKTCLFLFVPLSVSGSSSQYFLSDGKQAITCPRGLEHTITVTHARPNGQLVDPEMWDDCFQAVTQDYGKKLDLPEGVMIVAPSRLAETFCEMAGSETEEDLREIAKAVIREISRAEGTSPQAMCASVGWPLNTRPVPMFPVLKRF